MSVTWVVERFEHESGSKFYELVYMSVPGKSPGITVRRWGKRNLRGRIKIERDDNGIAFRELKDGKSARGYRMLNKQTGAGTIDDFGAQFSEYRYLLREIGNLLELDNSPETPGSKSAPQSSNKSEPDRSKDPLWGTW